LWEALFTYDELHFVSLLSRVRTGHITNDDVDTLKGRLLPLHSTTIAGRMKEIVDALKGLPQDTACLLPTRHMCVELNREILNSLPGDEIRLIAVDSVDCPVHLCDKIAKKLSSCHEDSTVTAGLEKEIIIKVGCKIMLKRNIDVTFRLVNGAIGTISSVKYSIDQAAVVEIIVVKFEDGWEHKLEKVRSKFQVLDNAFVYRQQFPITSAYAITVHKSQGLTLRNVVTDIGTTVFTCRVNFFPQVPRPLRAGV